MYLLLLIPSISKKMFQRGDEEKDTRLQLIQKAFDLPSLHVGLFTRSAVSACKNIGELLLLSQLGAENLYTAITLNPTTKWRQNPMLAGKPLPRKLHLEQFLTLGIAGYFFSR